MSGRSPASVLFTVSGVQMGVFDGQPATTSGLQGLVVLGSDGSNLHHIHTASDGTVRTDPTGTTAQPVTDNGSSLTVDAVSWPLPTGASTEATLSTRLADSTFTARFGEVQTTPTSNTLLGRLKDLYDAIVARLGTLGQKAMSASTPVVIASDQSNVPAALPGLVSTSNSSTTPLGSGATFTGAWEDVSRFAAVVVTVFADQDSLVNEGLKFEFSSDGSNVDVVSLGDIHANQGRGFRISPRARYFRVRVTNGAVAQSNFRLSTFYSTAGDGILTRPLGDLIHDHNFGQIVRAIINAKNLNGDYIGLAVDTNGRLVVSSAALPPPNTTPVNQSYQDDVATSTDNVYVIPNGAQLYIQRFAGGAELDSTGGNKIELFWDPNGNGTGMTLLRAGYVSGNNISFDLDYKVPLAGNGTRSIRTRRFRFSGGSKEIAAFWDGYY